MLLHILPLAAHTNPDVINNILERDVQLNTIYDLIES